MLTSRHYEKTDFITGLRAIAVFLVFLIHSGGGGLRELGGAFYNIVHFGRYGVEIFFVISGFTIFHQLFEGEYTYKRFLLIRVSRISLPYFPILIFLYIYINLGGTQFNGWANKFNDGAISLENLMFHFTYMAFFDLKYIATIIGIEWTLHIEFFFYVILGFFITRRILNISPLSLLVHLLAWFLVFAICVGLVMNRKMEPLLFQWMPFRFGWMFLLGGIGYYLRNILDKKVTLRSLKIASNCTILSSIVLFILFLHAETIHRFWFWNEFFFAFLTFVLLVLVRDEAYLSPLLTNTFFTFLGSISYSVYLVHIIIIQTNLVQLNSNIKGNTALFFANLILTIFISFIWYKVFEQALYGKVKGHINKRYSSR